MDWTRAGRAGVAAWQREGDERDTRKQIVRHRATRPPSGGRDALGQEVLNGHGKHQGDGIATGA